MAKIVEIRDPYTAGHQQRVAQLAQAIAQDMGLDKYYINSCYMTGRDPRYWQDLCAGRNPF